MSFIKYPLALLAAIVFVSPAFADDSKECASIAKSCLDAGYTSNDDVTTGKQFWMDCMKPLVLGKTVSGVTVDPKDVKACRAAKIKNMEQELKEFKAVK